jgi:uncharacterized protein GlcG (DUF336 family)
LFGRIVYGNHRTSKVTNVRETLRPVQQRLLSLGVVTMLLVSARSTLGQEHTRLTLADAKAIIAAAQQSAGAMNARVSIAVVDPRGDLIALERMPGASAASVDATIGKAMVSAIYLRPSGQLAGRATAPTNVALNEATGNRLRFLQGGVPVVRSGLLLGAVAAGGATSQQDEAIATDGAAAIR